MQCAQGPLVEAYLRADRHEQRQICRRSGIRQRTVDVAGDWGSLPVKSNVMDSRSTFTATRTAIIVSFFMPS